VPLHVLVVDDDELNRLLVKRVLEGRGVEVEEASSGIEALVAMDVRRPDLIVLDIVMPGMNGVDVLDHVRSTPELAAIPIIMLSGRSGDDDLLATYRAGADYYLTKPLVADELLHGIALIFGRDAVRTTPELGAPRASGSDRPRAR
jgi:CheY-like chemotaxis protein